MIIIILAAGKGNRLKKTLPKSFSYETKSLIPIKNEPAIKRLINQFLEIKQHDILLVLGHHHKSVLKVFNDIKPVFVLNKNYERDSNLRSLFLGFEKIINEKIFNINDGVLVIEADSFFHSELLEEFLKHINYLNFSKEFINKICWTTKGKAMPEDTGGFIDPFENSSNNKYGDIKDIYIKTYPNNKKRIGNKDSYELTGYFHEIIFDNFSCFSNSYYDLGSNALSFNDFEEYSKCLDLY